MDTIARAAHHIDCGKRREKIEWLNYWWSSADADAPKRYLLIGDSISRQYRGKLETISGVPVDYIGTSSFVLDERFLKEIEAFFDLGGGKNVLGNTGTDRGTWDFGRWGNFIEGEFLSDI